MDSYERLTQFGFGDKELELLSKFGARSLSEFQQSALRALLADGRGATLLAPTSSGKTFLFIPTAISTLAKGGKCILAVSSKAHAHEFATRYLPYFDQYGFRCASGCLIGALKDGNFDIAVGVYETLYRNLPALRASISEGSLFACDEIDLLFDNSRGAAVESVIRFAQKSRAKMMCMSATLDAGSEIVRRLGLPVLSGCLRAVNLRMGIVKSGRFEYTEFNSGRMGSEILIQPSTDRFDEQEEILRLAQSFALKPETTLVFLKDRDSTRRLAMALAARMPAQNANRALASTISALSSTYCAESLKQCLPYGIGFHSADLTQDERNAVEDLLFKSKISVLFCTTTLGAGVNFPVVNVIVESSRWEERDGRLVTRPIHNFEFLGLAGRAGRFGLSPDEGRAMLILPARCSTFNFSRITESCPPAFLDRKIGEAVSQSIFCSLFAFGSMDAATISKHIEEGLLDLHPNTQAVEGALSDLVAASLVTSNNRVYRLSRVGMLCAESGLSLPTCMRVAEIVETLQSKEITVENWFWEACGLNECRLCLPSATGRESADLLDMLDGASMIPSLSELRYGLENGDLRRLKGVVVLRMICEGQRPEDIEKSLWVSAGIQQRLSGCVKSITRLAARIAVARGAGCTAKFFETVFGEQKSVVTDDNAEQNDEHEAMDIKLLGQARDRSGIVVIDGKKLRLRLASYNVIESLFAARKKNDGWVRAHDLTPDGDSERARKYISQLRTELRPYVRGNPVENDGDGSYRLSPMFKDDNR